MAALPPLPQRRAVLPAGGQLAALAHKPQTHDSHSEPNSNTAAESHADRLTLDSSCSEGQLPLTQPIGAGHRRNGTIAKVAARRRANSNSSQGGEDAELSDASEQPATNAEDWSVDPPVRARRCGQVSRGSSPPQGIRVAKLQLDSADTGIRGDAPSEAPAIAVQPSTLEPRLSRRTPLRSHEHTPTTASGSVNSSTNSSPALEPHSSSSSCSLPAIALPGSAMTQSAVQRDGEPVHQRRRSIDLIRRNLINSGIPTSNARTNAQVSLDAPATYSTPQPPRRRLQETRSGVQLQSGNRRASLEVPDLAPATLYPATQALSPSKRVLAAESPAHAEGPTPAQHVHRPRRVHCPVGSLAPLLPLSAPSFTPVEAQSTHPGPVTILSSLPSAASTSSLACAPLPSRVAAYSDPPVTLPLPPAMDSPHSSLLIAALLAMESHTAAASRSRCNSIDQRTSDRPLAVAATPTSVSLVHAGSSIACASPTKSRSRRSSIRMDELHAGLCTDSEGSLRLVTDDTSIASPAQRARSRAGSLALELSPASQHMLEQGSRRLQPTEDNQSTLQIRG